MRENFKIIFAQSFQTRSEQRDVLKTAAAQSDAIQVFTAAKMQRQTQNQIGDRAVKFGGDCAGRNLL